MEYFIVWLGYCKYNTFLFQFMKLNGFLIAFSHFLLDINFLFSGELFIFAKYA